MKAICIIGSPRSNGSSGYIIDRMIEGMKETGIECSRYCLGDLNIGFCVGCKNCHNTGSCIQNDDMDIIMDDLISSDILLIASPSYWGDVTGQLKVFFDRNTPYSDTNLNVEKTQIPQGKKGVAISIRAGKTERENLHIIESIEHYFGHLGIKAIDSLTITGVDCIDDLYLKEDKIKEAYLIGKNIMNLL